MSEQCKFPLCKRVAESNGYCIGHRIYSGAPTGVKPAKPIQQRSEKQKGIMKELKKLYKAFLSNPKNQKCKVKMDGCTGIAETVHHVRGRIGEQVFVQKDWLPSCSHCNIFLEHKDAEAREKGVKKSKFSNQ